jgi:hypothetical protein
VDELGLPVGGFKDAKEFRERFEQFDGEAPLQDAR